MQLLNITQFRGKAAELVATNATTLLTAGGIVGSVTTAVLAGRAGFKAAQILAADLQMRLDDMPIDDQTGKPVLHKRSRVEVVTLVGPQFILPVFSGGLTIAAIFFSHRMSAQKAAALAAAYGLSQKQFDEYRAKVAEKLTGNKQTQIVDELAQEAVDRTPGANQIVVVDGEVLCFDKPTGRYFRSTMEKINRAVNKINEEIIHTDFAVATQFYEQLGLPATTWSDEVGWNTDQLLELSISTVLDPQKRPCIAIDFKNLPKVDYVPKSY